MSEPVLSVVVLAWDNLPLTRRFVESVRAHTDVDYELVIVDNGSASEAAEYARHAADHAVLNDRNLGFAVGMNQGLAAARGEWIAFCNNDTVVPAGWASMLVGTGIDHPQAAVVVPAITAARSPDTVRSTPGTGVRVLPPFSAPPPAVLYLMRRAEVGALGGWGEEYAVASGEDVDLCFKVWVNDRDIVFDERVLVDHVGHATAERLPDSEALWARNRRRFLDAWIGPGDPPRLASCAPERFARNRETARAVAGWMDRYFSVRDRVREEGARPGARSVPRRLLGRIRRSLRRTRAPVS